MSKIITIHLAENVMDYPNRYNSIVELFKAYVR